MVQTANVRTVRETVVPVAHPVSAPSLEDVKELTASVEPIAAARQSVPVVLHVAALNQEAARLLTASVGQNASVQLEHLVINTLPPIFSSHQL